MEVDRCVILELVTHLNFNRRPRTETFLEETNRTPPQPLFCFQATKLMGKPTTNVNYEDIRTAQILENQAILASLGIRTTVSDLRQITCSAKSKKPPLRKSKKKVNQITPLRRSERLRTTENRTEAGTEVELKIKSAKSSYKGSESQLSPEASARRCNSKGRGSVYDAVYGICCHFCRQKKLCGEEDCKRCGDLDLDEPCLGKTDCSVCHSSTGVFCRACLKVRYGEEIEDVAENKEWMCPHCVEKKGKRPFWICNSSICLKKRHVRPTGIAIYKARELGYESVAHLLMDELKRSSKFRG